MDLATIAARALEVFAADVARRPATSLRGGDALDDYREPPPFDAVIDAVTDDYLRRYAAGLVFVDAASWRHYLPPLMDHTARHFREGSDVIENLLNSLRPPDRDPPRLASLTPEQETVVTAFLEALAFGDASPYQTLACQVLEEWWMPGALYR